MNPANADGTDSVTSVAMDNFYKIYYMDVRFLFIYLFII